MTTATSPAPLEGAGPGLSPPGLHPAPAAEAGKLYAADVAALAGVKTKTITHYLWRARVARADGTGGPWHLPEPAGLTAPTENMSPTGHSGGDPLPWWDRDDITAWLAARLAPGHHAPDTERITTP